MPGYLHMNCTKYPGHYLENIYASGCRNQLGDASSAGIVNFHYYSDTINFPVG